MNQYPFWDVLKRGESLQVDSLCPAAKAVPSLKRTADVLLDTERKMQREAYVATVDMMWKNPEICILTRDFSMKMVGKDGAVPRGPWEDAASLATVDRDFWKERLVKTTQINWSNLKVICDYDPDNLNRLIQFKYYTTMQVKLPEEARSPAVLSNILDKRDLQLGNRLQDDMIEPPVFGLDGKIEWVQLGPYAPMPIHDGNASKIPRVQHRPTGDIADIPSEYGINLSWQFLNNHSDELAIFKKGSRVEIIKEFFDHNKGPWKIDGWTRESCEDFNVKMHEAINEQTAAAGSVGVDMGEAATQALDEGLDDAETAEVEAALAAAGSSRGDVPIV